MPSLASLSARSGPGTGVGIAGAEVGLGRALVGSGGTVTTMTIAVGFDAGGGVEGSAAGGGELHAARSRPRLARMTARRMADILHHSGRSRPPLPPGRRRSLQRASLIVAFFFENIAARRHISSTQTGGAAKLFESRRVSAVASR